MTLLLWLTTRFDLSDLYTVVRCGQSPVAASDKTSNRCTAGKTVVIYRKLGNCYKDRAVIYMIVMIFRRQYANPYPTKLIYLILQQLEVMSHYRDPQPQVVEN